MKAIVGTGLLGGLVLIVWTFVVNGIFGFQAGIDMKRIPAEIQVYEVLKQNMVEPGRYIINPEPTSDGRFPNDAPVFSVLNGGMGHESAGGLMFVGLAVFLLSPVIATWMLSQTSGRLRSSYGHKVLFFVAIGLLFALFSDLMNLGIGGYPVKDALALAANDVITWTLVGLVVAWRLKPRVSGERA